MTAIQSAVQTSTAPADLSLVARRVLHAAWLSVLIGIGIEIALLITAAAFGKADSLPPFIADLGGKVTWSLIVCAGLAAGTAAAKARPAVMGILGLFAAPGAFIVAKTTQKSLSQALSVASSGPAWPTAFQMGLLRAIEYAILGVLLGWASRRPWGTLRNFVLIGFATGIVFGAIVVGMAATGPKGTPPTFVLVSRAVNEVLFPIGCSVALWLVLMLGRLAGKADDGFGRPSLSAPSDSE